MSITPRPTVADNLGWQPCIEPHVLGRLMDRLCEGRAPTLREKVTKALDQLLKKLAR